MLHCQAGRPGWMIRLHDQAARPGYTARLYGQARHNHSLVQYGTNGSHGLMLIYKSCVFITTFPRSAGTVLDGIFG
jgi:hypothetical protein